MERHAIGKSSAISAEAHSRPIFKLRPGLSAAGRIVRTLKPDREAQEACVLSMIQGTPSAMQREVCPRNRIDRLVANGQQGSLGLAPLKTLHMPYHAPGTRGGLLRVISVVRALLIVRGDCLSERLPALDGARVQMLWPFWRMSTPACVQ